MRRDICPAKLVVDEVLPAHGQPGDIHVVVLVEVIRLRHLRLVVREG